MRLWLGTFKRTIAALSANSSQNLAHVEGFHGLHLEGFCRAGGRARPTTCAGSAGTAEGAWELGSAMTAMGVAARAGC